MRALRSGGGPDAERAIHVYPGALLVRPGAEVSRAGSNAPVLTLPAWMQTIAGPSSAGRFSARMRPWSSTGRRMTRWWPKPAHAQAAHQRRMRFIADDDGDGRRAEEAVGLDIPAHALQNGVARGEPAR